MDFSQAVNEAGDLSADPLESYAVIAENALRIARNEIRSAPAADEHLIISQLMEFLRQLASQLDISQPPKDFGGSVSDRLSVIREHVSAQRSKLLATSVAQKIGKSDTQAIEYYPVSNAGIVTIHGLLVDLRIAIENTELSEKKKSKLKIKLEEFERELVTRSVSGSTTFKVLAIVAAGLAGTTSTLADGPDALETIGKIAEVLGIEKQAEEQVLEIEAEAETKALPSPDDFDTQEEDKAD